MKHPNFMLSDWMGHTIVSKEGLQASIHFRYIPEVQKDGRIYQVNNPEVTVDVQEDNGIISVQIFNLKLITSKLQNAYNGLEVEWGKSQQVNIGIIIFPHFLFCFEIQILKSPHWRLCVVVL